MSNKKLVKIKIEKAKINGLPPHLKGLLRPSTAYAVHHSGGTPGRGTETYANSHMPCGAAQTGSVLLPCCQVQQTQLCLPHSPPLSCVNTKHHSLRQDFLLLVSEPLFIPPSHLLCTPFRSYLGILIPQPGIEPACPALEAQS